MGATLPQLEPSPQPVMPSSVWIRQSRKCTSFSSVRESRCSCRIMGVTLLILSRLESVRAWFRTEFVCAPVQALTALVPGPTLMAPPPKMPAATDLRKLRLPGVIALLFRIAVLPVLDGNAYKPYGAVLQSYLLQSY